MNYKILKRVLDELNKETPKLDYIRGMVETLLSLEPEKAIYTVQDTTIKPSSLMPLNKAEPKDEGSILDAMARANLKTIQNLAKQSSE